MTGTVDAGGQPLPADVGDRLRALNATGPRILRHTEKATTVAAQWRGRRVVVKAFTTTDAYWRYIWRREAAAYAAFAAHAPPVIYGPYGPQTSTKTQGSRQPIALLRRVGWGLTGSARQYGSGRLDRLLVVVPTLGYLDRFIDDPIHETVFLMSLRRGRSRVVV
jgi:hypothetical protein